MKFYLALIVIFISSTCYSQYRYSERGLSLSLGSHAVNSQGSQKLFYNPSGWITDGAFILGAEIDVAENTTIISTLSLANIPEGSTLEGITTEDFNYFALDVNVRYYFGRLLFPEFKWIDFYGSAGFGYFKIDDNNISFNLGGGATFWFSPSKKIGLNAQLLGKIANNAGIGSLSNNHFQYSLQLVYRFTF
jgi:hypothetical protein